jgi:hypothetical protein
LDLYGVSQAAGENVVGFESKALCSKYADSATSNAGLCSSRCMKRACLWDTKITILKKDDYCILGLGFMHFGGLLRIFLKNYNRPVPILI